MDRPTLMKGKEIETAGEAAHDGAVLTARFNGKGNFFFTGGKDKVLRIWNTSDCSLFGNFGDHTNEIRDVCVTG
jgi:WD40 repeat protein